MKRNSVTYYIKLAMGIFILSCLFFSCPLHAKASTKLIGHRGYSGKYTENSINAMEKAYESGFDGIELDLWEAKDHTLWIFHDQDMKRMTGKKGKIYNLKYKNRSAYKLKNGTVIPTLDEMLQKLQEKNNILIHIKGNGHKTLSKKAQNEIVSTLKKYNLENNVYIFASETIMNKLHFGSVKTGWITSEKKSATLKSMVKRARKKKVKLLILTNASQYKAKRNGASFVSYAHKRGISTGLYYTKKHSVYNYLCRIKADYALSDYYVK